MQSSNIPAKFGLQFAANAGPAYKNPIPAASQIGVTPGAASLNDGFPPLNFIPVASGGIPPRGPDMNGILNQITAWNQWQNAGGPVAWDATFSAAIGGYPKGATVVSPTLAGVTWLSTVENNTTNPDAGGAGWLSVKPDLYITVLADTGTANAYSAVNPIPLTSTTLVDGTIQKVRFAHTNTGASTYGPDGLAAKKIVNLGQGDLIPAQIFGGLVGTLRFDAGQNYWILLDCSNGQLYIPGNSYGVTQALNDNTDRLATTAFVQNQIGSIVFFTAGTRMPFAQSTAPTGWTQDVSDAANNRMLRVINGAGGGATGGSSDPTINNVVPSHTHGFTTGYMSNDHSHGVYDPAHTHGMNDPGHNHTVNDPTHAHSVYDPTHAHSVADPGHTHTFYAGDAGSGSNYGSGNGNNYGARSGFYAAATGIGIYAAATGIGIYGAATGIYLSAAGTGTYLSYAATGISTYGVSANHTHSGGTDNGSSQTNWVPRYINMIICTKN